MQKIILLIAGIFLAAFVVVFVFFLKPYYFGSPVNVGIGKNNVEDLSGAKVLFLGDMMFDRWIRIVSEREGFDFVLRDVEGILKESDLVVGNLEGPITSKESVSAATKLGSRENYIFTFPSETASRLYEKNIRLVNLGNNHIFNFGSDGLNETKGYLQESKVDFFGDVGDSENRFIVREINGIKIAFLSYNQFVRNSKENTLSDLKAVKEMNVDFVVVYAHWGKEYKNEADEKNVDLAHEFVENGTDLIIGSHPHVVQQKEKYHGKMVYYSLGNFVFDQYFDDQTRKGMMIEAEFGPNGEMNFKEMYVEMKTNGKTVLLEQL